MNPQVGGTITIDYKDGHISVRITKSDGVPASFWLKAQADWGSAGRITRNGIETPLSTFLRRLEWLPTYCRTYNVRVSWTGSSRAVVEMRRNDERSLSEVLDSPPVLSPADVAAALSGGRFIRELKEFQIRNIGRLIALPHGADFSVPGAGKTTVALAVYEASRLSGRVSQLLVVSPLSAFDSWMTEAELSFSRAPTISRFSGGPIGTAEVLLVNYQRLASGFDSLCEWVASRSTHVILDEAHRMKRGWKGEWGRNCLNLASLGARRDILTGTPAPQSSTDLVALFDFLWPGQARRLIDEDRGTDSESLARIATRIKPLFVRTTKSELGLREPRIELMRAPLGELHGEIYEALRGRYRGAFELSRSSAVDLRAMGQVIMYLLEAATNPGLLVAGSHRYDPIQFRHPPLEIPLESPLEELLEQYRHYEIPWKLTAVEEIVAANRALGRKTLVWSNFVRNLETLKHHVLADHNPAMIHGGVTDDRDSQLARFRDDPNCWVLVANPAATGEGVSLHQVCHDAVYLERTFNAGQYLQSVDRIHRLGLRPDDETRVKILVSEETIDLVVDSRIRVKTDNLGKMMNDSGLVVMALPGAFEEGLDDELDFGTDNDDLREVAHHLTG